MNISFRSQIPINFLYISTLLNANTESVQNKLKGMKHHQSYSHILSENSPVIEFGVSHRF